MAWLDDLKKSGWLGDAQQTMQALDAQNAQQAAGNYGMDADRSMSAGSYSDPTTQALQNLRQKVVQQKASDDSGT